MAGNTLIWISHKHLFVLINISLSFKRSSVCSLSYSSVIHRKRKYISQAKVVLKIFLPPFLLLYDVIQEVGGGCEDIFGVSLESGLCIHQEGLSQRMIRELEFDPSISELKSSSIESSNFDSALDSRLSNHSIANSGVPLSKALKADSVRFSLSQKNELKKILNENKRKISEADEANTDLFKYSDWDEVHAEIAEIFSTEEVLQIIQIRNQVSSEFEDEFLSIHDLSNQNGQSERNRRTLIQLWIKNLDIQKLGFLLYISLGFPIGKDSKKSSLEESTLMCNMLEDLGAADAIFKLWNSRKLNENLLRLSLNVFLVLIISRTEMRKRMIFSIVSGENIISWAIQRLSRSPGALRKKFLILIRVLLLAYIEYVFPTEILTESVRALDMHSFLSSSPWTSRKSEYSEIERLTRDMGEKFGPIFLSKKQFEAFENLPVSLNEAFTLASRCKRNHHVETVLGRFPLVDFLFSQVFPHLDTFIVSLLRSLICTLQNCKEEVFSFNEISMSDKSMGIQIECIRHRQILAKNSSAILLYLLKIFKRNRNSFPPAAEYPTLKIFV